MSLVPKKIFFVKGKGYSSNSKLRSFEEALRDAGIEKFNLVKVSSIIPPHCEEVLKSEGLKHIETGQVVYSILSRISSNNKEELICSSIGVAKPANEEFYGYLSEHQAIGIKPERIGKTTEGLAAEMLTTTLGIPFNSESDYDEKQIFKINGKIIETKNITEFTTVKNEGEWATVLAAAIFIL